LEWERNWDGIKKMREWIITNMLVAEEDLMDIEHDVKQYVRDCRELAWGAFLTPVKEQVNHVANHIDQLMAALPENEDALNALRTELVQNREPLRRDIMRILRRAIYLTPQEVNGAAVHYYEHLKQESGTLYS
jgi:TPP-dependent pyruvate/acetoin dehydrogenase alpha subunit